MKATPTSTTSSGRTPGQIAKRNLVVIVALTVVALIGLGLAGCTRTHYRTQADCVVEDAVGNATANPRFELPGYGIDINPQSRLYDPTDPDFPPMAPDDPDSHRLMEWVDGHRGWPHWEDDGVLPDVEVNDYQSCLPYGPDGQIHLDLRGAVELARLHSREYQQQMETLYLSALDVTAERFAFQAQFYGGNITDYFAQGPLQNGGTRLSTLSTVSQLQMNKAFVTGGTLVTGIANSIIWQFQGSGQTTTNLSLLNFAFSQPLLQFAGRPYIMERLTRVERGLLANVRQFDRFKQGFYLNVTTATGGANSLVRIGGLNGGSGLTNFTGVGAGGFGGIGNITNLSAAAGVGNQGIAPGGAGGFWFFLQNRQNIRNIRAQNTRLRDTWLQLTAMFDAGRLDNRFQVDLARQAYYGGQSTLLSALNNYDNFLDLYKVQTLALPPNLQVVIDDPLYDQFNLMDPELTALIDEINDRMEALSGAHLAGLPISREQAFTDISTPVRGFIDEVVNDMKIVDEVWPKRRQSLIELAEFPELKENHFDNRALTPEAMQERVDILKREFPRVSEQLMTLAAKVDKLPTEKDLTLAEHVYAERDLLGQMSSLLLELSLLQARARLHGISSVPVNVKPEVAFQVALSQRADWMNAKASLVDSWRLIRYNANQLRSNMQVNIAGEMGTTGNNPVKFSGTNGTLNASVSFNPPLTRVIQRNQFRESLIVYQQQRRALMAARDEMHRSLRTRLRQIRLDQLNIELRRLAVDVSITQTDVTRLKVTEPERPAADGKISATTTSPTVARDLVDALQVLVQNQQALINVWGDYEITRRQLDFEMGTMQLDDRGIWIDPGPFTNESVMKHYYNFCPGPFAPEFQMENMGEFQLSPGELPPEPSEGDLLAPPEPSDFGLRPPGE